MSDQETSAEQRLEVARREIKNWRAGRLKLGPMPPELWAKAIALAGEVGVARVSRAMEMNHGALSRRCASSSPKSRPSSALSEFVEVSRVVTPPLANAVTTVIELTSSSGSRLTVRLSQPVDVGLLLSQFQARQ